MKEFVEKPPGFDAIEKVTPEHGTRYVRKAREHSEQDYARQLILAHARHTTLMELPYRVEDIPHGTDAELWYCALTSDNPPGRCVFDFRKDKDGYARFATAIMNIDMGLYDPAIAAGFRVKHSREATQRRVEFDAIDAEVDEA